MTYAKGLLRAAEICDEYIQSLIPHAPGITHIQVILNRIRAEASRPDVAKMDYPMGAIENGRIHADRLERDYQFSEQGGTLAMCADWQEFRQCFEWLATHFPREASQPECVDTVGEVALNVKHKDCHKAANAFWQYWRENGVTHKHGYYESTWGAINQALRYVGVVPHEYKKPRIEVTGTTFLEDCIKATPSQPEGVVVPAEPTQAMHVAMYNFFHEINYGASAGMWKKKQITTELYKVMLRAAGEQK